MPPKVGDVIVISLNRVFHAALLRDLTRLSDLLEDERAGNRSFARAVGRLWDLFDRELARHRSLERTVVWPALTELDLTPERAEEIEARHEAVAAPLAQAGRSVDAYRRTRTAEAAEAAREDIGRLRDALGSAFEHEEGLTEQQFRKHQDHPVVRRMQLRIGKGSAKRAAHVHAWLSDGAPEEMVPTIRRLSPGPVMLLVGGRGEKRYRKLVAKVAKG